MARRPAMRTMQQFIDTLDEEGVQRIQIARYFGIPKQAMNNGINQCRAFLLPNSPVLYQAIDDIKRGVLRDPEAE